MPHCPGASVTEDHRDVDSSCGLRGILFAKAGALSAIRASGYILLRSKKKKEEKADVARDDSCVLSIICSPRRDEDESGLGADKPRKISSSRDECTGEVGASSVP